MNKNKIILPLLLLFFFVSLSTPAKANASLLDDVVGGVKEFVGNGVDAVKDLFTPDPKKEFTIESNIGHAPGGDVDKDGEIEAGDIIRFSYTLANTTDQEYTFATLKTNIQRDQLNFIHNVKGTASLSDDGKAIVIPNYRIAAGQISNISFDARVNYFTDKDSIISTEAELLSKDKKSIIKALKKEVKAKHINRELLPGAAKGKIKKAEELNE